MVILNGKTIGATLLGIVGALALYVGMCMSIVWNMMVPGILVGIVVIVNKLNRNKLKKHRVCTKQTEQTEERQGGAFCIKLVPFSKGKPSAY